MADMDKYADEMLSDDELDGVAGGSIWLMQKAAEKAGITLLKEDGSPGKWGYFYNEGDYYWHGFKISDDDAYKIAEYTGRNNGRQPQSLEDVNKFFSSGSANNSNR